MATKKKTGLTQKEQTAKFAQQAAQSYAKTSAINTRAWTGEAGQAVMRAGGTEADWNAAMQALGTAPVAAGGKIFGSISPTGEFTKSTKAGKKAQKDYKQIIKETGGHVEALTAAGGLGNTSGVAPGATETDPFVPYAEADVATTSYKRAQGKAYGRGEGGYLAGQTEMPKPGAEEDSAVVPKKGKGKHPARKVTKKAKAKKSPGGAKVTTKERAKIQATKARARKK